ncbi:hypothetical protein [Sphingomonas morindae]|uniref:Uncharacterized protein n=1 Tax=Sphingomonas morindae TaxID=1541170 RepID=A0ABY4X8U1_9SPHN|nr:hypothetical protein [Sphingomonas morindae]USI73294.1 hypothetical protein LHA26_02095 [Sphingomonas morindae]
MVNEREPRVTTDELRAGTTPGVGRKVLVASLVLIVILFAILLIVYR